MAIRTDDITARASGGGDPFLAAVQDIVAGTEPGLYHSVNAAAAGGVASWRIDDAGQARRLDQLSLGDGPVAGNPRDLLALPGGQDLLLGGLAGGVIRRFDATGDDLAARGRVDGGGPEDGFAARVARPAGGDVLVHGGQIDRGLVESWRLEDGTLADRRTVAIPGADRLADLAPAQDGGTDWLVAATGGETALALLRLDSEGRASLADTVAVAEGLGIAAPAALAVAQVAGESYAILAAAGSSSLSVFRIDPAGRLEAVDHVIDGRGTRFAGACEIAVADGAGGVHLAVAGSDDGVSVLRLLPGGRLSHVASLADTTQTTLASVSALSMAAHGDGIELVAASGAEPGLTRIDLPGGPEGTTRIARSAGERIEAGAGDDLLAGARGADDLRGGAGSDVLMDGAGEDRLTGGAGADTFVFEADGALDRVLDFEVGVDRLDLSAWSFLRSVEQIEVQSVADGAVLRFGDEVLRLVRAGGGTITQDDLRAADPLPLSRMLPAWMEGIELEPDPPPSAPGGGGQPEPVTGTGSGSGSGSGPGSGGSVADLHRIKGSRRADELGGGEGDDLLIGKGGADTLSGGDGADVFVLQWEGREDPVWIRDFEAGDRLALDDRYFNGERAIDIRDVTPGMVRGTLSAGRAEYERSTGRLWFDPDGDQGGGDPFLVALLSGAPRLEADDLLLF
ncbi:M10 family metallopeptidase C-terminal domain-containing protein [Wenxinia marina]|uniref:M10 family metallopeptidase C-terminal domain-containing protein n=1 Tax=Wenxinia marina TaxID=390641 RepID=UPI00036401F6|nr:hypothetical protein [Wenxinia marina]GGL79133.1 hypothetical protein GCM10011392_37010 [Wenxinia marina]